MFLQEQSDQQEEKGFIKGEILYTIFHNEDEHFSIAKVKIHKTNENYQAKEIVIKGYFSNLQDGTIYSFFGQIENHPKFGEQYRVNAYQTYIPKDEEGLIAYLSSDLFHGIGKKTAQRIIDHLGGQAISKILNNPEVVHDIPQLNKKVAEDLVKTLQENQGFEQVVIYLSKYGLGLKMCQNVYENYKDEAINILQDDPYQYVFDIEGFGFHTADNIAKKNGISLTHPNRIGAACIYVLEQSIQEGHVYIPIDRCIQEVISLLSTDSLAEDDVMERIKELNNEKKIIVGNEKVYLPSLYYAEDGFSSHIKRIISKPVSTEIELSKLMKIIGDIEEAEVLSYGTEQFEAINQALHSKIMIVTGGPGTGKTTVIKGILNAYARIHDLPYDISEYENKSDYPFVLAAPTGRAAKRLNESTGLPAVTIHRLLGWNGSDQFDKDEVEQLEGKYLIIDEFSMVDIWLANHLFKAIPDDMQVLLVGDEDQLPSVGPGQVLSDLLSSGQIPYVSLHEVYRQKEGSKIIELAHEIKNDTCDMNSLRKADDFSFISCNKHQVVGVISSVFMKAKEKGIELRDIQVLAPMYKTQAGINEINKRIQEIVNPRSQHKRERKLKEVIYRVGDKVIQLVNQPEEGISNGDIGEIVAIFEEDENKENEEQIVIAFEDREIVYERKDYVNFMHAYCISIHKSQGSEFPIVVLPVISSYYRMLRKNLLYTAVTRGKSSLIICGEQQAFLKGVHTLDTNKRYSSLKKQLVSKLQGDKNEEKEEETEITPYDFM